MTPQIPPKPDASDQSRDPGAPAERTGSGVEPTSPPAPRPRRRARILAMQLLCQLDVQGESAMDDVPSFLAEAGASGAVFEYAAKLTRTVWGSLEALDQRLEAASPDWRPERMSTVERNILRIAASEMLEGQVPARAAIDEAIEIAKEYGGVDTPRFVNGVLDAVYRKIREETGLTS